MRLTELENFENFATNMEKDAPSRFKEWFNELSPEDRAPAKFDLSAIVFRVFVCV